MNARSDSELFFFENLLEIKEFLKDTRDAFSSSAV